MGAGQEAAAPVAQLSNWNVTYHTKPAVVVAAKTVEDVCRVVGDSATYPTPVLPVGSMHSVNECIINDGGTLINVSGARTCLEHLGIVACAVMHRTLPGPTATNSPAAPDPRTRWLAALNQIKGLEGNVVRVQTGVKLADLHDWLGEQVRALGGERGGGQCTSVHNGACGAHAGQKQRKAEG